MISIRKAELEDVDAIKKLADAHKKELGFVHKAALTRSIERSEVLVVENTQGLVGFLEYRHLKQKPEQTTVYYICVTPESRFKDIGKRLMEALRDEARDRGKSLIQLKCPVDLPATVFYERLGFQRQGREEGKEREIEIWHLEI